MKMIAFISMAGVAISTLIAQDNPAPPQQPGVGLRLNQVVRRAGQGGEPRFNVYADGLIDRPGRPLIIRTSKVAGNTTTQLQEDLAVMSRVLEKTAADHLGGEPAKFVAGITILALPGNRGARTMYLEDYGAIFTLNVNVPLKGELKSDEPESKEPKAASEEWEEARNEIFGQRRGWSRKEKHMRREFDPKLIEEFRNSVIESLRNASNIRNLKENDWITVIIQGRETPDHDGFMGFDARGVERDRVLFPPPDEGQESTVVVRVRKSDVDDFAKKKGGLEEFKRKVSIATY
jgi:hypothetical protein